MVNQVGREEMEKGSRKKATHLRNVEAIAMVKVEEDGVPHLPGQEP